MPAPKHVDIITTEVLAREGDFCLERARLRHERYDGAMSGEILRLNFERGDSVAALVHRVDNDAIVLTEQFRYPAYRNGAGWVLELPAGMVTERSHEDPATALKRELMEEIGYQVRELQVIAKFYPSVGASSERVHLFYAQVTGKEHVAPGGGCSAGGEDIRRVELNVDEAFRRLNAGEIVDAKAIIGLQWLCHRRASN